MSPTPLRRLFGFGLLLAQLGAGGATSLAHARERLDAPRHIESASTEQCLVVHDATRCVVCAFSHARATAPADRGVILALPAVSGSASPVVAAPFAERLSRSADARAPPLSHA